MTIHEMKQKLQKELTAFRYEHTLGVEYTACALAMRYGADVQKARIAGLLHDCAKQIPTEEKIVLAKKYGLEISEFELQNPELLHAKVGACVACSEYGVKDPEILSAITWHTTGKPEMSLLDKILYIADYMEPNRDKASNLTVVRKQAFEDLELCLYTILKDSIAYLASRDFVTDPMTQKTFEYYEAKRISTVE